MTSERDNPKQFFHILFDSLVEQQRLNMRVSEFDERLERLTKNGSITGEERKLLLELANAFQSEGSWMSFGVMNFQLQDCSSG